MPQAMTLAPEGFVWRKYEVPAQCWRWVSGVRAESEDPKLILWRAIDEKQLPELNRWEALDQAFLGFVSVGLSRPFACCYDLKSAMQALENKGYFSRTWNKGADAAELMEVTSYYLLGVWHGDSTPYFHTKTPNLADVLLEE